MHNWPKIFAFTVLLPLLFIGTTVVPINGVVTEGYTIMIYLGGSPTHSDISDFIGNYSATNTILSSSNEGYLSANLTDDVNVLLLPGNDELTDDDVSAIINWFYSGSRLLWIGSDSDYGGYQNATAQNNYLFRLGAVLRFDTGAILDPVVNDGASYRPRSTGVGSGPIATAITENIDNVTVPFHGPTSIIYEQYGIMGDLRNITVANTEVILTASPYANAVDQDISLSPFDFYENSEITGNYPLMAVEKLAYSMLVVSGESIFTSYKNMYGYTFEKSGNPHAGKAIVDNTISYFFDYVCTSSSNTVTSTSTTSTSTTSTSPPINDSVPPTFSMPVPINMASIITGLFTVVVIGIIHKKKYFLQ